MENLVDRELQGKVLTWNYLSYQCFGLLTTEEFPDTVIHVQNDQLSVNVTQEMVEIGTVCRFLVKKDRTGQYHGHMLTLLSEEKANGGTENIHRKRKSTSMDTNSQSSSHTKKIFEFTYMNPNEISMMDPKDITQIKNSLAFFQTLPTKTDSAPSTLKMAVTPCRAKGNSDTKDIFVDTMEAFSASQLSQFATDLYSNTKKGDAFHAQRVESNYLHAAQYLLHPETSPHDLTLDVILEVHRLTTDQLLETAGVLRLQRGARAGGVIFPPPSQVLPLLGTFVEIFQSYLETFFAKYVTGDELQIQDLTDDIVREACSLVGWTGYHFVNIHPFNDGNGRTVSLQQYYYQTTHFHLTPADRSTLLYSTFCAVPSADELGPQALSLIALFHSPLPHPGPASAVCGSHSLLGQQTDEQVPRSALCCGMGRLF
jgi:fido (protein-threonine AMPylation protein)